MIILLSIISLLFLFMSFGLFFGFTSSKNPILLIASAIYGISAIFALVNNSWLALIIGLTLNTIFYYTLKN